MASAPAAGAVSWIESNLAHLGKVTGEQFQGGSSWSSAYIYTTSSGTKLFVKTALGRDEAMFRGEALGLQAMYDTHTIRTPKVLHYGPLEASGSFIVMEALDMGGSPSQAELGRRLALMHLAPPKDENAAAGKFGFPVNNTIGGTPQPNAWMSDWVEFFREKRLAHQIKLAGDSTLSRLGDKLLPNLGQFFEGAGEIKPSVLHGDLWSGNISSVSGEPVIFDPATYYGHHEAEWGMSWCAGFGPEFWNAYHELVPRAPGWEERHQLYTLYHILNHYNLFGGSYYNQAKSIMNNLVAKV